MIGILVFAVVALIAGIVLVTVESKLSANDKIVEKINSVLPGYNCGACGYPGCEAMALKILSNIDNMYKCRPMKDKDKKIKIIEKILEKE